MEENVLQSSKLNGDLIRVSLAVMILCLLLVGARMRGQEKADVTVRVKVVNVPATVRDKHGKIVNNLTKDDFVLEEDGRPQTLHYFSQESSLPLTLGLLVDTSMSQRRVSWGRSAPPVPALSIRCCVRTKTRLSLSTLIMK